MRRLLTSTVVGIAAFLLLWSRYGNFFFLSMDEGIYLEGAVRVARGQAPYRDFFTITGPATFWLYGAIFKALGETLAVARAVLCIELALLCAAVCWLTSQLLKPTFAAITTSLYAVVLVTSPFPLYVTHRWDSNLLAILAIAFAWSALRNRNFAAAAGLCAGTAIWFTPPMAILCITLGVWLFMQARPAIWIYLAGAALPALLAVNTIPSLLQSLLWDATNYAAANKVSYGVLTGELPHAFTSVAAIVKYCEAMLPAILPILGAIAIIGIRKRADRKFASLLMLSAIALLATAYPRFGGAQLWFISPIFWIAASAGTFLITPEKLKPAVALLATAASVVITYVMLRPAEPLKTLETNAGNVKLSRLHFVVTSGILESVRPGDSLFVFPYLPIFYFATGGVNPTRYSYMQPGMMGPIDEKAVLKDLRNNPPKWVIHHTFSEAFIMKNWPASDRTRLQFSEIEEFLKANYKVTNPDEVGVGYRLLQLKPK